MVNAFFSCELSSSCRCHFLSLDDFFLTPSPLLMHVQMDRVLKDDPVEEKGERARMLRLRHSP
jgi:hypothetical protein